LRLSSFGGYGLALAALALVVFGAYDSYPLLIIFPELEYKVFHNDSKQLFQKRNGGGNALQMCLEKNDVLRFLLIGFDLFSR